MSEARAEILRRIREATRDVRRDEPGAWIGHPRTDAAARAARHFGVAVSGSTAGCPAQLLDLLAERVADYQATVTRVAGDASIPGAVGAALARRGARRVVIPAGLPAALRPARPERADDPPDTPIRDPIELLADRPPLTHDDLAAVDGVLTGCALAIAQTGTIVLDASPDQGRRALTLLPDLHVCIVRAHQVVASVPDAIAKLAGTTRPITLISGPSATSDIELERVEGLHGPRQLDVIIAA